MLIVDNLEIKKLAFVKKMKKIKKRKIFDKTSYPLLTKNKHHHQQQHAFLFINLILHKFTRLY